MTLNRKYYPGYQCQTVLPRNGAAGLFASNANQCITKQTAYET